MKRGVVIVSVLLFGIFFVTNLYSATFDLTGDWEYTTSDNWAVGGIGCSPGPDASGHCKIVQTGDTFTFAFTSGYVCVPPESCTFEGTVNDTVYTCSTTDIVDDEGGMVTSVIVVNAASKTSAFGTGEAEYTHPSGLWECRWGFNIALKQSGESVRPDIKVNGSDGPVKVLSSTPVAATISLDPGEDEGRNADWWIAVNTPFDPPGAWYSYVYPDGWLPGIDLCVQAGLFEFTSFEVLNMMLPEGRYTFYFAIDDPDGLPMGPWKGMDSVEVIVE